MGQISEARQKEVDRKRVHTDTEKEEREREKYNQEEYGLSS